MQKPGFSIDLGKYRLEYSDSEWWLVLIGDGEGMTIDMDKFNEMVDKFYKDNF